MKSIVARAHSSACVAAACSSAAAQETGALAPPAGEGGLAALSFLAGCWAEGPEGLREQYTAPTANLILGTSRYVRGGRVAGGRCLFRHTIGFDLH